MRAFRILCCLAIVFVFAVNFLCAGESPQVLFDAAKIESDQVLILENRQECSIEERQGIPLLVVKSPMDPYRDQTMVFRFAQAEKNFPENFVLEIEFYDEGAGIIAPQLSARGSSRHRGMDGGRQCSYTRLNTLRTRSAFFEYANRRGNRQSENSLYLSIASLQFLKSIKMHRSFSEDEWTAARNSIPVDVKPMVVLDRPMDIVCGAGVATRGGAKEVLESIESAREMVALAKALGFNAIESYVRWNIVEPEKEGQFDWSAYDAVTDLLKEYDMKWFPLLIVGSAYALPDWFAESKENIGFVCLEHGISDPIQSIWSPYHQRHVTRFLKAFGEHYEPMNILQGVRLGPSGNFGESQYPAGGNWGYHGEDMHIHIGYWCGDEYAIKNFRDSMKKKYETIDRLNKAWNENLPSFEEIEMKLPVFYTSQRHRIDMTQWYTQAMTDWCEWWAIEAKRSMPNTMIYQSSGGWGFLEAGTDFAEQAKSMAKVQGGIRLTNETDSFHQNIFVTRLAAAAARHYGVRLGYEPASSHTARGTTGRVFNTASTNGDHFFTYGGNILGQQSSIENWLKNLPVLDTRQPPIIDVAIYYPETMNQLDDGGFRFLYGWGFYPRAREVRERVEVDYLNETLIRDGFLDRYKVLVCSWGEFIEADVQNRIDQWVRAGGTLIYPSFPRGPQLTVEGDSSVFQKWSHGDCGKGAFHRFRGDMEPPDLYGEYVEEILLGMDNLHPFTKQALQIKHPPRVYFSIQEDGHVLAMNYDDEPARVELDGVFSEEIAPYQIARLPLRK